jgi:hypothetical protein
LYKQTTEDTIRARYQASLFGGKEKVIARLMDLTPAIADSDSVVVRVPNLVPLPSGTNNLITFTSTGHLHSLDSSNYGIESVCTAISRAITDYAVEYQMPNDIFLAAIDMSLPFGGKFEIHGDWESDRGPHEYHRIGKSVDFSHTYRNANGRVIPVYIYNEDDELIETTNQINEDTLDDKFDRRGFNRWERPQRLIHYESRH